jgi:hypothetical protein
MHGSDPVPDLNTGTLPLTDCHLARFFRVAASLCAAALILSTWTIGRGIRNAVSQSRPGLAPQRGQTKVMGLVGSFAGSFVTHS